MRTRSPLLRFLATLACGLGACGSHAPANPTAPRSMDFNFDWQFHLGDDVTPHNPAAPGPAWLPVRLPHDWSVGLGFTREKTGASTGFLPGGIGWYRKDFFVPADWRDGRLAIVFEGIYRLSRVWLNGVEIGGRPSGYVSFDLDLTPHLRFGETNTLLVRVDHSTYLDSRWYTGSGIYRNVRLVRTAATHIPEWGVWVQTPRISCTEAGITVTTDLAGFSAAPDTVELDVEVLDPAGAVVASARQIATVAGTASVETALTIWRPQRWDLATPRLYTARVRVARDGRKLDETRTRFGVRTARFDANRGFLLNDRPLKLKGVNLHHDAGLVGAAVPKDVWRDRVRKLQGVGVNAIRFSHNPHSVELLELCDELGVLVMNEFFDEWRVAKSKNLVYLSDNQAPADAARGYSELYDAWAERDLKATIRRDRNHPSVILWSIGNEIEWTYPYYPKSSSLSDGEYHSKEPDYDPVKIRERMAKLHSGPDELLETARKLTGWVRETDPTRPVTAGLVQPSVGFATGFAGTLDVVGFNYRMREYDPAHRMYPDAKILGTENWGSWPEWQAAIERDFVAGIFIWTGFAYLGEAGPWPRKGLEISLFDFAGFQTPRGHLFEAIWMDRPKVWLGATAAKDSEHAYNPPKGWVFTPRAYDPPAMKWVRPWEWDRVAAAWNFPAGEPTIVQAYSNCETVELLLNGRSLGQLKPVDFPDRIARWAVPFEAGTLELVGYNSGRRVTATTLRTHGTAAAIDLKADRAAMPADRYSVARVELQLRDAQGVPVVTADREVEFEITGPARLLGVDNGWENSVQPYQTNKLTTWQGRALLLLQAEDKPGTVTITARSGGLSSPAVSIALEP